MKIERNEMWFVKPINYEKMQVPKILHKKNLIEDNSFYIVRFAINPLILVR